MKPILIGAAAACAWCLAVILTVYLQRVCAERQRWCDWRRGRGA